MKRTIYVWLLLVSTALHAAELPVRQVVLYKHGVGYFERSGQLGPGESAQLDFKASEMNDVLKSLTVEQRGGGGISALRYDSSDPLEKKLAEFPFRLGPGQPLSAMLDQLKGAVVELKYGSETVRGAILSGRTIPATDNQPASELLSLLLDTGEMRTFDLAGASSIRLVDATLQAQFQQYLAVLIGARSTDKRSVFIDSSGAQARDIMASYMIPMPVWKSSYRLIWGAGGEPTLEGWAIVDNTTGEDWNGVQLALVSGRPISFISRLYEPRYIARPVAELPEDRPVGPVILGGAIEEQEAAAKAAPQALAMRSRAEMPASAPAEMADAVVGRENIATTIANAAAARELGELFEYRFSGPVTIRRNESAMLPFLQQKVTTRKLLVYSDQSTAHPMHSAEISNSTGKTLDGGPITVYEHNAYAGEALMETLKTGDKRLISYGVDLGTRITTQFDTKGEVVREVHMRRGVLTTRAARVETRTYTIRNVDQKEKTLILEHPARPEYKLIDLKPLETTANAYRFEVKLGPDATAKFSVTEERVFERTVAVANLTPDVLVSYVQNKDLSAAAREHLEQILEKKRQIAASDGEMGRVQQQVQTLFSDQERIRQNINSLNRVSGQEQQVQTYARQLATQEGQLATLRDRLSQLEQQKATQEGELNSLIERMEF